MREGLASDKSIIYLGIEEAMDKKYSVWNQILKGSYVIIPNMLLSLTYTFRQYSICKKKYNLYYTKTSKWCSWMAFRVFKIMVCTDVRNL